VTLSTVLIPALVIFIMVASFAAIILSIANKKFRVKQDPRIEEITEALPGANCGACGFGGCSAFAEAIIEGGGAKCPAVTEEAEENIAKILGLELASKTEKKIARVMCSGTSDNASTNAEYLGIMDCRAAKTIGKSEKSCTFACYGLGTCAAVCPFGAIKMENRVAVVDSEKCTGCGICISACPQGLIALVYKKKTTTIACSSYDKGAVARGNCKVACIACTKCVKECPVQAISIKDSLAVIDYEKCVNCKKCIAVCPMKTIREVA
jgi:Na+-translocating ferredoxin:NAD+ oxidoreductase subunit B